VVGDRRAGDVCVCLSFDFELTVDMGCGWGREEDIKRRRGRNSTDGRYDEGDGGGVFPM
jgi:hypothetical protein